MKKKLIIALCLLSTMAFSQDYYIIGEADTIKCASLEYQIGARQKLKHFKFVNEKGENVTLTDKIVLKEVSAFYISGRGFWERIPMKPHAPANGILRYTKKATFGKLEVYYEGQGYNNDLEPSGIYRFHIKMPDGKYYKVYSKGNMKKVIKPFLQECSAFTSAYSGSYSDEPLPFIEMINLYNSLCE